jgi:two-component system CheB/CheR fusion protein
MIELNSALKKEKEDLKKVHKELETLFETIEEVLFSFDMVTDRLIQISAACEKVYGHTPREFMADAALWIKLIHPDDKNVIEGNDEQLRQGKTVINLYRIIHKNTGIRWIEVKVIPTLNRDGILTRIDGITKDITEKRLVEESLQQSEANLRSVFDNTDTGYLLIDADLKLISFNGQAKKFAEQDLHQILAKGDYMIDYFVPERKLLIKKMMEDALQGINCSYELNYPQPDGSARWYYVKLFGVPDKDRNFFSLTMSVIEITERKLAERKLTRLNAALEKRAEELAVSNEELERFAYVASHDLQEPLRMVSSFLQLLQKKYNQQLDEEAQKYINFAAGGADRMKTLIADLLDFSRITTVKKEHTAVNLNELANKTLHILRTNIDECNASIIVAGLPEVYGDESQLMQLFQNLTTNALKYRGNVSPVIEWGFTENKHEWEFFVKDNGIGIEAKHFEKIFIIFQRLHTRTEYSGTGIGLAICKKIVELHGGKIWVESSKEKGSTFYFTISRSKQSILKQSILT